MTTAMQAYAERPIIGALSDAIVLHPGKKWQGEEKNISVMAEVSAATNVGKASISKRAKVRNIGKPNSTPERAEHFLSAVKARLTSFQFLFLRCSRRLSFRILDLEYRV